MSYPTLKYAKGGKRSACSGKLRYGAACRSRKQEGDIAESDDRVTAAKRKQEERLAARDAELKAAEMALKSKMRERAMEQVESSNFDARTEGKVIKQHERDMRRKYRSEGVDDPLKGQRTAGDIINRLRGKSAPGQTLRRDRSREPMFGLDTDREYNVRYNQGVYSNPRFMNKQQFEEEELSERARGTKIRRDRRKERKIGKLTDKYIGEYEKYKEGTNEGGGTSTTPTKGPKKRSGKESYIALAAKTVGGACKKVWDNVKHAWTLSPSCRGNKSAYNKLGGYM